MCYNKNNLYLGVVMNLFKRFFLAKKIRKLEYLSKNILGSEYKDFEKFINLFYNNRNQYINMVTKNKEIFGTKKNMNILESMMRYSVFYGRASEYSKNDLFDKNIEWNRAGEIFDFLFQDLLSNDIILEILRKCLFTEKVYDIKIFFDFITKSLDEKSLKMYFFDDNSDSLIFFILDKSVNIKYKRFSKFLSKLHTKYKIYSISE